MKKETAIKRVIAEQKRMIKQCTSTMDRATEVENLNAFIQAVNSNNEQFVKMVCDSFGCSYQEAK